MNRKALLEALAEEEEAPQIAKIVAIAMEAMSRQHTLMAEALLRQNAENMIRFQAIIERQQLTVNEVIKQTLDHRLAVVDPRAYATVSRSRPRTSGPTPWAAPKSPSSTDASGPAVPSVDDVEPFDDEQPGEERVDVSDEEVLARVDGMPPRDTGFAPPRK